MTTIRDSLYARIRFLKPAVIVSFAVILFFIGLISEASANSAARSQPSPVLKTVAASQCPLFDDDLEYRNLAEAIRASIGYYQKLPTDREFSFGRDRFSAGHLIRSMQQFLAFIEKKPSQRELAAFINQYYRVYAYQKHQAVHEMLFTGYYEPLLYGSLNRTEAFAYPVYTRPDDLVTVDASDLSGTRAGNSGIGRYDGKKIVPYYTRQQITEMTFSGISAQPIAWVNDPVDLFFLQIQGSGKISLDTGRIVNVHYQISNGHPYKSIGKYLIDKQKLSKESVSMQSIREYLNAHPEEVNEIFNYNPRYIFFETVENGPIGCLNVALTPGRSLALDRRISPAGALVFVQTEKPKLDSAGQISEWIRFSRFMLNQDTGSAIKGPGRADIFWGNGPYAELAAGYMKHPGKMYFLVLKPGE